MRLDSLSILQLNSAAGLAGGEQVFLDLCRGLATRGHRVGAVVRTNGALLNALREADVEITLARRRAGLGLLSGLRLARIIDSRGWQVLNAHTPPDYVLAALARRLSSSRPKLVLTRHILLPLGRSLLHKWALGSADAFVAVSNAVKETLENHPFIDASKVRTIWNGIDVEKFVPDGTRSLREQLGVEENEPLVGILGDISPHKGQEAFVKAALLLGSGGGACPALRPTIQGAASNTPTMGAKFVVAGPCKAKNRPYLERLVSVVKTEGLSSHVRFIDRVSDMPDAMRSLDVMVLASEAEPFGLVTVEAMACGCAVIATRSGASSEIVTDRRDGLLVKPGSHEAIADAIEALLKDEALRTRLCEQARQTAVQKFTLTRNIDEIEGLFRELCEQDE
ncbi:MAG: glycosyltransferase family 4 protein [Candidatus Coatesbacteria bacterium]|nr:glycosyltransferase family 4 protein [Candidatus Coatesbacteria bacterium]